MNSKEGEVKVYNYGTYTDHIHYRIFQPHLREWKCKWCGGYMTEFEAIDRQRNVEKMTAALALMDKY